MVFNNVGKPWRWADNVLAEKWSKLKVSKVKEPPNEGSNDNDGLKA